MASPFITKIRTAISNDHLQYALDANAERRRNARLQGYVSLPIDINLLRQRAHAMRADVIANLDGYLDEFIGNAQRNGIIVHRAANAAQAVEAVLEIASKRQARLVAKAKTMVGEETRINEALQAEGIEVVETDLGEYIVQLRGEPPAHIITPAVHLLRADVGKTFNRKLGLPYTEDVSIMTAAARKKLRQVFLDADIGISGVNIGVAENGMLVLVTNEGNGRMVTTLPRIHIALMGIERLVPTLDDLALVIYLLPRSATGQKMAVYTSLLYGPRRPDDSDGPEERHLILVDNGRSAIAKSSLHEALFCVRCGACLNTCPVFREIGGHAYVSNLGEHGTYPGPIGSVLAPSLFGYKTFGHLVRACSLCGACKDACPMNTNLPRLILTLRAGHTIHGAVSPNVPGYLKLGIKLFKWLAIFPGIYASAQRTAGRFRRVFAPHASFLRLPAFTGWGLSKDISWPATSPFRDRFSSIQGKGRGRSRMTAPPKQEQTEANPKIEQTTSMPLPAERFCQELVGVGARVILCTPENLSNSVVAVLRENRINTIQAWNGACLPAGLLDRLQAMGIEVVSEPDPGIRAGLTGASGGIVESGTLLIPGGLGRPLTASLLPEIHLAVVQAGDLYLTLPEALQSPALHQTSASVLLTGPSRTADVEMTMSIGMHGPRELHVFFLTEHA